MNGNVSLVHCMVLGFAALVLNVTRPHVRCVVGELYIALPIEHIAELIRHRVSAVPPSGD